MNAEEARKMSKASVALKANARYIKHINARITTAARDGRREIKNPQIGTIMQGDEFYLTSDTLGFIRRHYENEGFKWVDYPDPDPGHPCGGAYTILSW